MPRPLIPDRRERILDAAEAFVLSRGFDAMTVSDVAASAGIGKGAVYLEFAGKAELLDALLRRGTDRMSERVRREIGDAPRLSEAYTAAARALLDDALMTAAFLDDRAVLGRHVHGFAPPRYRDRHDGVVAWLRDLQGRGEISASVDPEHLALALSSATIGLLSASRLLGPLTEADLEGAITALGAMAAAFETEH